MAISLPRGQLFSEHSTDNPKKELGFFIFCKCDFVIYITLLVIKFWKVRG